MLLWVATPCFYTHTHTTTNTLKLSVTAHVDLFDCTLQERSSFFFFVKPEPMLTVVASLHSFTSKSPVSKILPSATCAPHRCQFWITLFDIIRLLLLMHWCVSSVVTIVVGRGGASLNNLQLGVMKWLRGCTNLLMLFFQMCHRWTLNRYLNETMWEVHRGNHYLVGWSKIQRSETWWGATAPTLRLL